MVRNILINNRAKKAVRELQTYISELPNINSTAEGTTWKAKVLTAFSIYLGNEAELTKRLEKSFFTINKQIVLTSAIGIIDNYVFEPTKKENFKSILQSAIQIIKSNGVKKDYIGSNIFKSFSNEVMLAIISGVILLTYTVTYQTTTKTDAKKDEEVVKEFERKASENLALTEKAEKLNNEISIYKIEIDTLKDYIKKIETPKVEAKKPEKK